MSILNDLLGIAAINQKLDSIISTQAEIEIKLDILIKAGGSQYVIPDLEAAVQRNAALVKGIDEQVPD